MTINHRLPHFVIIGAVKGATTWIHNQLRDNPAVYLPAPEPHFFSQEYDCGLDHYRRFFDGAAPGQLLGEKSADYLAHPLAAARMASILPQARLVIQLRNPVDRAYSDYKMLFRRGTVTQGPEAYLDGRPNDQPRFLEDGLYARHIRRWLDHFSADQIKIILFEDVKATPEQTVATVSAHIGAPCHYSERVGASPRNDRSERFLPLPVRTALAPLKQAARPLRGNSMFERVRGLFARQIQYPPLPGPLRARMMDYYARDIDDLETLIGRDLSHWKQRSRLAA